MLKIEGWERISYVRGYGKIERRVNVKIYRLKKNGVFEEEKVLVGI